MSRAVFGRVRWVGADQRARTSTAALAASRSAIRVLTPNALARFAHFGPTEMRIVPESMLAASSRMRT